MIPDAPRPMPSRLRLAFAFAFLALLAWNLYTTIALRGQVRSLEDCIWFRQKSIDLIERQRETENAIWLNTINNLEGRIAALEKGR